MIKLEFPAFEPRIRQQGAQDQIWDGIRRKWVMLTPEEWVRQHFIHYLTHTKGYPASLLAVEKTIRQGDLIRRFDIVAYGRNLRPFLLVECKEMNVPLTEAVLEQALHYNLSLQTQYLAITNGVGCYAFALHAGTLEPLNEIPRFKEHSSE